ncbi:MAG: hypothetical protein DWQ07_12250 [Chloroflexi bacterium]|nr:MAG: hypothetical protein DWQ07_12250 [Chloroflexota bacterium]
MRILYHKSSIICIILLLWYNKRMNKLTISAAIESYLLNLNDAPLTKKQYKTALRRFQEYLSNIEKIEPDEEALELVTLAITRNFVTSLKDYSSATERAYTYALYGFLDEIVADPEIEFSLDMYKLRNFGRKRLRKPPKRLPIFPKDEIELLLDYVVNLRIPATGNDSEKLHILRTKALVLTLTDTGLRIHEACKLRRGDLDHKSLKAVVTGKGDKQALVRFTPRAVKAISAYLKARQHYDGSSGKRLDSIPIFIGHDRRGLKQMKAISTNGGRRFLAEIVAVVLGDHNQNAITPHMLRHYFITRAMIESGGNLRIAQELARHSELSTTERYAHLNEEELDAEYEKIFIRD